MGSKSPFVPISLTRYKYILNEFSTDPVELAKVLADKRFGSCDACGSWDYLLVHHWTQEGAEKVCTKELCNRCNTLLPSGSAGDHVLPCWDEQMMQLQDSSLAVAEKTQLERESLLSECRNLDERIKEMWRE